jgi:tetratricopeptide (TPR) repeat protein
MNKNIEQGKKEFDEKNYKNALDHFKKVAKDDEEYEYAQVYSLICLMELKCYREALKVVNSLISKDPYSELLWYEKARCHIFLKQNMKARSALGELERVADGQDKESLLDVARLYSLLDDYGKVIEYCDKALAIDGSYKAALYEKALAASDMEDDEMVDSVSAEIINVCGGDLFALMPVFLLKLFSKKYGDCLDIIEGSETDDVKKEFEESLKAIIYNRMSDDLNAKLALTKDIDLPIDEALKLMFEFKNAGKDHGEIRGVHYYIL